MITNKTLCKILQSLTILLWQFIEALLVIFVTIIFAFFRYNIDNNYSFITLNQWGTFKIFAVVANICTNPANFHLNEDVFKTSWSRRKYSPNTYIFRRRLQDQHKRLGHTPSRCFQDVFRMSSRHLAKTSPKRIQNVFKTSFKDLFKTFSRSIMKLNCSC